MKKRICRKLRSKAGETIAEVLISLLISSVALILLAQMIGAATNMVTSSENTLKAYYEESNNLAQQTTGSSSASVTLTMDGTAFSEPITVDLFENEKKLGGVEVTSYKLQAQPQPEGGEPSP